MFDIELFKSKLNYNDLFSDILYFEETISTNIKAKEISAKGNLIVVSDYQSSGKGRFDRKWESEKNKNLIFTLKMNLDIKPQKHSYVTFFFAYCVYSGITNFMKHYYPNVDTISLNIKWPNDILWFDKKLCGLLIETKGKSGEFIMGIGVNVNQNQFPEEFCATSLSNISGSHLRREDLLLAIISQIAKNYYLLEKHNFDEIFRVWKNSTKMIGNSYLYSDGCGIINQCEVIDLHEDGSIELLTKGAIMKFYSGDIKLRAN